MPALTEQQFPVLGLNHGMVRDTPSTFIKQTDSWDLGLERGNHERVICGVGLVARLLLA